MRSKLIAIFLLTAFSAKSIARAAGPVQLIKVNVECQCNDQIASRVCYAVKEKIRASHGFKLVSTAQVRGITVHLLSIDTGAGSENAGDLNLSSAIAETLTLKAPALPDLDIFLTQRILLVGSDKVDVMADDIVSGLDQETDFMRKDAN